MQGLSPTTRAMLGLMTVVMFSVAAFMFYPWKPWVGIGCGIYAALRLVLLVRGVMFARQAAQQDEESAG